jgi:hypothetical protein
MFETLETVRRAEEIFKGLNLTLHRSFRGLRGAFSSASRSRMEFEMRFQVFGEFFTPVIIV